MIVIRQAFLRKFGLASIVMGLIIASVVGVAFASGAPVSITSPSSGNVDLYFDANNNHVNEPAEFVGNFPVYPATGIVFKWTPYSFPAGVNGAYQIALWQNTTPLGTPTWVVRKVAHDFADNPAGTDNYLFGPFFSYEGICGFCPSKIVVQPEEYTQASGVTVYGQLQAALEAGGATAGRMQSDLFVLDGSPTKGSDSDSRSTPPACTSPQDSRRCCKDAGGTWITHGEGAPFCSLPD